MNRRGFLGALIFMCGCGPNEAPRKAAEVTQALSTAAPSGSERQSVNAGARIPRVVMLFFGTRELPNATPSVFRMRLTELGYVEGKSIVVEERYADGDPQQLTELAREIVESKPEVIVTSAF